MLKYINPEAKEPLLITLFTKVGCPYCARAKAALKEKGLEYEEIVLSDTITVKSLKAVTGATTVPQVYIDGKQIGDSGALLAYLKA
ncbi:MAG: glutathione S-transferase N-terminal domain-containing protein [Woronichinia naegeliana WA131]|uniref:Glutathione S-transferase N-terminal domain-containing protein n=1 Tax=Woronichinia naegeliana WA131 TaxID=2824559 RepID=A0A977L3L8_9CYAN|nr:MAG: glutathione S-transferase N-terminal domain-containing protein [Woronichinia naegeliana WA131]